MFEEEMARVAKSFDDFRIGIPDRLAGEPTGHIPIEAAIGLDRAVDFEAFAQTGPIVVGAVAGRYVDQPRAIFECYVLRSNQRSPYPILHEGMSIVQPARRQSAALRASKQADIACRAACQNTLAELFGKQCVARLAPKFVLVESVDCFGRDRDGSICR